MMLYVAEGALIFAVVVAELARARSGNARRIDNALSLLATTAFILMLISGLAGWPPAIWYVSAAATVAFLIVLFARRNVTRSRLDR